MPLTPIDIQQKTFGIALRGYDLDEVDDFLDEIVTSIKDYEMRLRDAQERIADLEREVAAHNNSENAISRALLAAQRSADSIVDEARAEAAQIVKSAEVEADQLHAARSEERLRLQGEIDQMRLAMHELRAQARVLAASIDSDAAAVEAAADKAESRIESVAIDEPTDYRPVTELRSETTVLATPPAEPAMPEPVMPDLVDRGQMEPEPVKLGGEPGETVSLERAISEAGVTEALVPEREAVDEAESPSPAADLSDDHEPAAALDDAAHDVDEAAHWGERLFESSPSELEPDSDLEPSVDEETGQTAGWTEESDSRADEPDEWTLSAESHDEPSLEPKRARNDRVADLPVIGEEPRPWLSDAIDIVEEGSEEWSGWSRTTKTDQRDDSTVTRPWERD